MGMHHRTSKNLIRRSRPNIARKLPWSFRCRVLQSDNILLKTIVNSMHFVMGKVVQKVECCYSNPQVMSLLCHDLND